EDSGEDQARGNDHQKSERHRHRLGRTPARFQAAEEKPESQLDDGPEHYPAFRPAPSQLSESGALRSSPTSWMNVSSSVPPARTSASVPCAANRPRWMIPTWVTSRSTTSRTWLVRKIVIAPRVTRL